jgi:TonB family protein
MNAAPTVPAERPWPRYRWALFIGLAYAIHVGFIFAFGDRKPVVPRATVNVPTLRFTTQRSEREQLDDPTLFALPHPRGFAGAAWLRRPQIEFAPFRWTEPPRLLALSVAQLGATFQQNRATNQFARLELETLPPPELTQLKAADLKPITVRQSTASLGGELAQRQWLNPPINLPPQPAADLLTNSLVQVWVQADGQILSSALLLPGSGSKEADQLALHLARAARFAPLPRSGAKLTHGTLIFEWHAVPQTNATPVPP